jgi:hypothetical protein
MISEINVSKCLAILADEVEFLLGWRNKTINDKISKPLTQDVFLKFD